MWQALAAGFMLGREVFKYLGQRDKCKQQQRKKAMQLVGAAREMRKARKNKDAKYIEDVFRALNLDDPDSVQDTGPSNENVES